MSSVRTVNLGRQSTNRHNMIKLTVDPTKFPMTNAHTPFPINANVIENIPGKIVTGNLTQNNFFQPKKEQRDIVKHMQINLIPNCSKK